MREPTERFSTRVQNYAQYRPSYPSEMLDILEDQCDLRTEHRIADIGSGTGILSRVFLDRGYQVWGVEPNAPMRQAAEVELASYAGFHSVDGRAESTSLPNAAVDFIVAGQAAHWFDRASTRPEFVRILKPGGWMVLVWNTRKVDATPFMRDLDNFVRTHFPRGQRAGREWDRVVRALFAPQRCYLESVPSMQALDWAGLQGRIESSSSCPEPGTDGYAPMLADLRRVYDGHQVVGGVQIVYDTQIYFGHLHPQ